MAKKEVDPREELRESYDRILLMSKLQEKAIEYILAMNPIEHMLKHLEGDQFKDQRDKVSGMINAWIDIFDAMLTEGRTLPVDMIGRASEIAKAQRESKHESTATHES